MSKNSETNQSERVDDKPILMIAFDPDRYSSRALALILAKSQEWGVLPLEAETRLLNNLAERAA